MLADALRTLTSAVADAEAGGAPLPEGVAATIEALGTRVAALSTTEDPLRKFFAVTPVFPLTALPEAIVVLVLSHCSSTSLALIEQTSKQLALIVPHAVTERMRLLGGCLPKPRRDGELLLPRAFFAETLAARRKCTIAAGGFHNLLLVDDGAAYSCGGHTDGSAEPDEFEHGFEPETFRCCLEHLGHGESAGKAVAKPLPMLLSRAADPGNGGGGSGGGSGGGGGGSPVPAPRPPRAITEVAAGFRHSLALDAEGRVWSCGQGSFGKLGTASEEDHCELRRVGGLLAAETVVQVAAGGLFSLALSREGSVFAFGSGGVGQLGLGDTASQLLPQRLALFDGEVPSAVVAYSAARLELLIGTRARLGAEPDYRRRSPERVPSSRLRSTYRVVQVRDRGLLMISASFTHDGGHVSAGFGGGRPRARRVR